MNSNKIYAALITVFIFFAFSCNRDKIADVYKIKLDFIADSSIINEPRLIKDSIIVSANKDSTAIMRYSNGNYRISVLFKKNDAIYERRERSNEFGEYFGVDSILTFAKKDTTFLYKSERNFIPVVQDYSYADCKYSIKRCGDEYITVKQSTIDTTYKEIFYYDKEYKINKYVNTWKDNVCVYIKKER